MLRVLLMALLFSAAAAPFARADDNQCPPDVIDCGCGTDPSCPGIDSSAYYIDPNCDAFDPSCDPLAGDIAADANLECRSVGARAGYRLCSGTAGINSARHATCAIPGSSGSRRRRAQSA